MATPPPRDPQSPTKRRFPVFRLLAGLIGLVALVQAYGLVGQEGQNDVAVLVAGAHALDPDKPAQAAAGSLVTVTGTLQPEAPIGDLYLKSGPYLSLERRVEMYAWTEQLPAEAAASDRPGQASYVRSWSVSPSPSEGFRLPEGHTNPPRRLANERLVSREVRIGRIAVPRPSWPPQRLVVKADQVLEGLLQDGYIYPSGVDPAQPRLGDERIGYWGVTAGQQATAIGLLDRDGKLLPYQDARTRRYPAKGGVLYDVVPGDRTQAVAYVAQAFPTRPNWSRRLELVGWLCLAFICGRRFFRRQ
jgi:hypothetical protein